MSKVKYGIVGIGRMGTTHAQKLLKGKDPNGTVTAICDIDQERREWAAKELPGVTVYDDCSKMLADKNVDAVVVVTPHYDHPVIGIEALKAGKHLLIEKPAGVYTKAVRELMTEAEKHPNQVFGIMFNQRTNPLYRKAKEIIDSGKMGELKRINWIITNWYRPQAYYDLGGWRGTWVGEGGGVLMNQAPHQLDLFQWLGGMPVKIRGNCKVGVGRKINVENDVTMYVEYANGASGVFISSTHDAPGSNRLEIDGTGGQLIIEQKGFSEMLTFNELPSFENELSSEISSPMPLIKAKKTVMKTSTLKNAVLLGAIGQHVGIFRNFSRAVLFNEPLIAPGADGIHSLTIANAAYLSSWLGKDIELPLDEDLFKLELDKRIEEEKESGLKR